MGVLYEGLHPRGPLWCLFKRCRSFGNEYAYASTLKLLIEFWRVAGKVLSLTAGEGVLSIKAPVSAPALDFSGAEISSLRSKSYRPMSFN